MTSSENTPWKKLHMFVQIELNRRITRLEYRVQKLSFQKVSDSFFRKTIRSLSNDLDLSLGDMKYCLRRYSSEGYQFLTDALPLLAKSLEAGIADEKYSCPSSFKKMGKTALPCFMGLWFSAVFHDDGTLRSDACPIAVKTLRQFLYFWYKIDAPCDPHKEKKVLDSFSTTELEIFQVFDNEYVRFLQNELHRIFGSYNRNSLEFKHGPGICSNAKDFSEKATKTFEDIPSTWAFPVAHAFNSDDFYNRILPRFPRKSIFDFSPVGKSVSRASAILVPKDSRGPRLISCEPMENQYVQQGIFKFLVDRIESDPFIKGKILFRDQSVNQDLARQASLNQEYSTLDLKEASDRVSFKLLQLTLPADVLSDISACRSEETILPDGRVIPLKKFAPMGSALCFPFLALVAYTSAVYGMAKSGVPIQTARNSIQVYGDDIVVKTEYALQAQAGLESIGLVVNARKSFVNSRFAESCGFDGFDGNDVTPLRCKIKPVFSSPKTDPQNYLKCVAFLTSLKKQQLFNTFNVLKGLFEGHFGPIPYGSSDSPYICICDDEESSWDSLNHAYVAKPSEREFKEDVYSFLMRRTYSKNTWRDLITPPRFGGLGVFDAVRSVVLTRVRVRRHWRFTPVFYRS